MRVRHLDVAHSDDRGVIADVPIGDEVKSVSYLTTKAGFTRGNHYHRVSIANILITSGSFVARARYADGPIVEQVVGAGDLVTFDPGERHALAAISDSAFIMLRTWPGEIAGFSLVDDTVREPV